MEPRPWKRHSYKAVLGIAITVMSVALTACTRVGEAEAQTQRANRILYLYDLLPTHDYDLENERERHQAYDEAHLVATLQGIVNRERPLLYTTFVRSPYENLSVDEFWLEKLTVPGGWLENTNTVRIKKIEALLNRFRQQFQGAVVWDPAVPATSNVASTVAGAEDLVAVRYDPHPDSLYTLVTKRLRIPVKRWLVHEDGSSLFTGKGTVAGTNLPSTGSAKNDAYLWAKVNYLDTGRSNPEVLAYYLDAFWLQNPRALDTPQAVQLHALVNHDYLVSKRGFAFDLSPWDDETPVDDPDQAVGTDRETMEAILRSAYEQTGGDAMIKVMGFVPWAFKYTNFGAAGGQYEPVPSEWKFVEIASAYNAYVEADAHALDAMANASVFQHFPLQEVYEQAPPPTKDDLQAKGYLDADGRPLPKTFVALHGGDYDSPAWLYQRIPEIWNDPARGRVAATWVFNPNLADRAPHVMDYVRQTATEGDTFIAGNSGAGYVNPGLLEEPRPYSGLPSGLDTWVQHNRPYYEQWDLSVTGFIINGFARPMSEEGWRRYAEFSPGGVGANDGLPGLFGVKEDLPYILVPTLGGPELSAEEAADRIASFAIGGQFHAFRTILWTPEQLLATAQALEARLPNLEIVSTPTLLQLIALEAQAQADLDFSEQEAVSIRLSQPPVTSGLDLVPQIDAPFEYTEVGGESVLRLLTNPFGPANYLYLSVHDTFLFDTRATVEVVVEYYDQGVGEFTLEYDGSDPLLGALGGAYTPAASSVTLQDTGSWQRAVLRLENVRFANRQNGGADFRVVALDNLPLIVRSVEVRR